MQTITLPGLIDVHTHLRVPGGEHKEDFRSGTAAAIAGGITQLLAMPNTNPPLSTHAALAAARQLAAQQIYCDVGIYAGASRDDRDQLSAMSDSAVALKIYLNDTFGRLRVEDLPTLRHCFQIWPHNKMIAMHAEQQSVAVGIGLAATYNHPVHFCHISRREEIELIADAKQRGLPVTAEVTPHHLFMDEHERERLGMLADMRPVLGTADDVAALWEHIDSTIDCIATDHAPHTLAEKRSATPPPGVAGLETSLSLMLTAVDAGKLTLERLLDLMHHNPKRIFNLPHQPQTECEVALQWREVKNSELFSKCGWTPFAGRQVLGRVCQVKLRGAVVFAEGKITAAPGDGKLIS